MTATTGLLEIPLPVPDVAPRGDTVVRSFWDPARLYLGEFLQAAIRAGCGAAWNAIGGGTNVVERVEVNDPSDNTFTTAKLPCIVVMRENRDRKFEQIADGVRVRNAKLVALWIPPIAAQFHRANRESFFQTVEAVVDEAIVRSRTPGWVVPGDTDPRAAAEGSLLNYWMGALYPLALNLDFSDFTVEIEVPEMPSKKYPALRMLFQYQEQAVPSGSVQPNTAVATIEANEDSSFIQDLTLPLP